MADLFNDRICLAAETKPDMEMGHYGFPQDNIDFLAHWEKTAPEKDSY
jgi:hypothetical protein